MTKTRRDDVFSGRIIPKQSLRKGESYSEKLGYYYLYFYDENGTRKKLTSKSLEGLREKKAEIDNLLANAIKVDVRDRSLDDIYAEWLAKKRGLVEHTKANYMWVYEHYCMGTKLGKMKIQDITKGSIKDHYNRLKDQKGLSVATIDGLQTVINQVCGFAVDERYIRANPSLGCMTEIKRLTPIKQSHPALTKAEQDRFLDFIQTHDVYKHWYPTFKIFIGTGMRVAELTGLRWRDIDLEKGTITIDHGLLYFSDRVTKKCVFQVGKPKTKAGYRTIVMLKGIKEAFLEQKAYLEKEGIACKATIEGTSDVAEKFYTDFIFINRFGDVQHQGTLNKALKRIIRDANIEAMDDERFVMLPDFSCHCFRSTYITRAAEKNVPIEITRAQVGHEPGSKVTEQIYTTVHPDWQRRELAAMDDLFN